MYTTKFKLMKWIWHSVYEPTSRAICFWFHWFPFVFSCPEDLTLINTVFIYTKVCVNQLYDQWLLWEMDVINVNLSSSLPRTFVHRKEPWFVPPMMNSRMVKLIISGAQLTANAAAISSRSPTQIVIFRPTLKNWETRESECNNYQTLIINLYLYLLHFWLIYYECWQN